MARIDSLSRSDTLRRLAIWCGFVPLNLVAIALAVSFLIYGPLANTPPFPPGDFQGDPKAIGRALAQLRHQQGLDESWYRHGFEWPIDAVRGDLGTASFSRRDVHHLIVHDALMTAELLLFSVAIGTVVALVLALFARHSSAPVARHAVTLFAAALASLPGFFALVLLFLLPSEFFNYSPPIEHTRLAEDVWNNLQQLAPIAIVVGTIGGATTWTTIATRPLDLRHIAGLALSQVPLAMTGVIVAEGLFSIDGLGSLLLRSTFALDLPVVQSVAILILFLATSAYALRRALVGAPAPELAVVRRRSAWRSPLLVIALTGLGLFVAIGALAPFIEPHDPSVLDQASRYQSPSFHHLLGTTKFGQDELSRVIEATRTSLKFAAAILTFGLLPGVALGLAGRRGPAQLRRVFDAIADGLTSLPVLAVILVFVVARGPGLHVAAIPVGFMAFAIGVRAVDRYSPGGDAFSVPQSWTARCIRLFPALFEAAVLALLAEATIGFLGLGVPPGGLSLGSEIASGASAGPTYHALLYGPAAALCIGLLSCALAAIACSQRVDAAEPPAHEG